jgi:uncharacterized protein (DUF2141 family)
VPTNTKQQRYILGTIIALSFFGCGTYTGVGEKPEAAGSTRQETIPLEQQENTDSLTEAATPATPDTPTAEPATGTIPLPPVPAPEPTTNLTLTVSNIQKVQGTICYSLFAARNKGFFADPNAPAGAVTRAACVAVTSKKQTITIQNLEPGSYAMAIYHDDNGNGAFDKRGPFPAEDFGFSQNPPLGFGAPAYEKCEFTITQGENRQSIALISLG